MNGGFIKQQGSGEHQTVTFIFSGELKEEQVKLWNEAIYQLKQTFGTQIMGVTHWGQNTPNFDDPNWARGAR
jgi:hypothetical protein